MPDIKTEAKRLVGQLTRHRDNLLSDLARTEAALEDARRVLSHFEGDDDEASHLHRLPGRAAPPGEAQREALRLMGDGDVWTPAKLGKARGTSSQAAGVLLRRLAVDGLIVAVDEPGSYQISSLVEEQGLLPLDGSNDVNHA